ncbi:V-set domain containing T-cell activation inhibitor 1-like isoform X2 [Anoplopoma fimbria]|nr:V-set domain containing T-cell activation inhibitor 1-like isoform X2 [Anoplopoma fimbria]XP_054457011.1 V-set domain containing T-cell activation inhibitor 1-like isoform X2 [Anoplopoma fimbria]XP_054482752.1 V-set domain containing T-cell activation inhibitor 1-like isoform X2 [Anoplopoma fimbria]
MKLKPEQDAALQCQSHTDDIITLLDWNRPDLKSGGYVFFYRDERSYEEYQHPRYRGRVELRDPEMKNGDVTVLLRNVSDLDTGTYECRVKTSKTPPNETTPSEIKCLIHLTVTDSGHPSGNEDGYRELVVGLSVFGVHLGVFFLVVVGFMIFRKGKGFKKNNLYDPPVNEGDPET